MELNWIREEKLLFLVWYSFNRWMNLISMHNIQMGWNLLFIFIVCRFIIRYAQLHEIHYTHTALLILFTISYLPFECNVNCEYINSNLVWFCGKQCTQCLAKAFVHTKWTMDKLKKKNWNEYMYCEHLCGFIELFSQLLKIYQDFNLILQFVLSSASQFKLLFHSYQLNWICIWYTYIRY